MVVLDGWLSIPDRAKRAAPLIQQHAEVVALARTESLRAFRRPAVLKSQEMGMADSTAEFRIRNLTAFGH